MAHLIKDNIILMVEPAIPWTYKQGHASKNPGAEQNSTANKVSFIIVLFQGLLRRGKLFGFEAYSNYKTLINNKQLFLTLVFIFILTNFL